MPRSVVPSLCFIALAAISTATAAAAQITPGSTLTFSGTADATDIGLGGVALDFDKRVVATSAGTTGTFASLDRGHGATGKIADIRVGHGVQVIPNFLQFGGYKFTLLGLPSGRYGQDACYTDQFAVGQTCSPYQSLQGQPEINVGVSPFYVANVSSNPDGSLNSTAAFDLYGTVTGPGGATSFFTGTIASTFTGLPYQVVLYTLEQEGLQGLAFTGTFTATSALPGQPGDGHGGSGGNGPTTGVVTPEPSTLGLTAFGLLGVAGGVRRRRRSLKR